MGQQHNTNSFKLVQAEQYNSANSIDMVNLIVFLSTLDPTIFILTIVLIFILQSPLLTFPGYLIMMYTSLQLGTAEGTLVNYLGILLSMLVGYYLGRWTSVERTNNKHILKFQRWVNRHGMKSVVFFRLVPIMPMNMVSIGSGFSRLEMKRYMFYSALTVLPWILFWSYIGSNHAIRIIDRINLDVNAYHLVGAILVIFGLFGLKIYQIKSRGRE